MGMFICKYCKNEYTKYGIKNHESRCKKNPDRLEAAEKWLRSMRNKKPANQWIKAKETGVPYVLTKEARKRISNASMGRKHSEKTKKKISEKRKEYLRKNPDKVPYRLNHYSRGPSYAEEYWKGILDANELDYVQEYRIGLYSLDFAFVDNKIDLEIDGDQHYLDERIIKSDKRRTEWLTEKGWTVIRISWSEYQRLSKNERIKFVNNILSRIMGV